MNTTTESPVTFHIFRKDGSRNPDIRYSFLEKMNVDIYQAHHKSIVLEDKTIWNLILEAPVTAALRKTTEVFCLVSFQTRSSGNYAVARLYEPEYKPRGRDTNTNRSSK